MSYWKLFGGLCIVIFAIATSWPDLTKWWNGINAGSIVIEYKDFNVKLGMEVTADQVCGVLEHWSCCFRARTQPSYVATYTVHVKCQCRMVLCDTCGIPHDMHILELLPHCTTGAISPPGLHRCERGHTQPLHTGTLAPSLKGLESVIQFCHLPYSAPMQGTFTKPGYVQHTYLSSLGWTDG